MQNKDLFIQTLSKLIAYKSENSPAINGKPFGEENYKALNFFLDTAKSFGLEAINYENYIGEVRIGEGEEIGIIGHLDVVPAGEGWDTDPYTLTLKDGYYYGRGVGDDKLPTLLILFILKELKDSGVKFNKKIRLFAGCNEETGWKDVEYFEKNYGFPEYGFSPDGDFPVSYAEKGMAVLDFCLPKLENFNSVLGGTVINAVCAKATCQTSLDIPKKLLEKHKIEASGNILTSLGKSAHGSHPEQGENAIKPLLELCLDCGEKVEEVLQYLFYDKGGLSKIKTEQGSVTISPDLIFEKDNVLHIKCDLRYPYPVEFDSIKEILDRSGLTYTFDIKHPTQYVEKDGDFVKALMTAYNQVMGENIKPVSQCGSTFARVFRKGVAFGPEFPGGISTIHEPNERVSEKNLEKSYEIYKRAIFELIK